MENQNSKALIALMLVLILSLGACSLSINLNKNGEKDSTEMKDVTDTKDSETKDSDTKDADTISANDDSKTDETEDAVSKNPTDDSKDADSKSSGLRVYEGEELPFGFRYNEGWTVLTDNNNADGPKMVNDEEAITLEEDKSVPSESGDIVKIDVNDAESLEMAKEEFFKEIDEENTSEGKLESIGGKSVEVFTLDQPTGDSEYIYFVEHEGKTITIQGEDKAKLESIIESIE